MKSITPRIIKFQSVYKHYKSGDIFFREWGPIEGGGFQSPAHVSSYDLIAHRQFTGLHDKDGNELYEGDIVPHDGVNRVINFKAGTYGIDVPANKKGTDRILYNSAWVKIGTIFQNPELIEGDSTTLK